MNVRKIPAFANKRVCSSQERSLGAMFTDGSIVTSSINLYQYIRFVIITRRKLCLSIYEVKLLRFSVNINRTVLNIKLCKTEMVSLCLRFLGKMECKRTLFILQLK